MTNHYPNEQDAQANIDRQNEGKPETLYRDMFPSLNVRRMDFGGTIYCQSCKKWTKSKHGQTCGRCIAREYMGTVLSDRQLVFAGEFFADAGLSEREIDALLHSPDFLFGIEVSRKIFGAGK